MVFLASSVMILLWTIDGLFIIIASGVWFKHVQLYLFTLTYELTKKVIFNQQKQRMTQGKAGNFSCICRSESAEKL